MSKITIVGGGPSGAMCGAELARAGHDVQILTSISPGKNLAAAASPTKQS